MSLFEKQSSVMPRIKTRTIEIYGSCFKNANLRFESFGTTSILL